MSRQSWDETWMEVAVVIGRRALCSRSQVGAVITTRDNKVNSAAYVGPPAGLEFISPCSGWCPRAQPDAELPQDYSNCLSAHAEQNCVARADHSQIQGGTIYVSSSICGMCAKLIAASGLSRAVHVVRSSEQHRNPEGVEKFLRASNVHVSRMTLNDEK